MIFVTDDGKKDWWSRTAGKTHGPRPELVEEYYVASGERVHFYETRRFLAYAQKSGAAISNTSVEEVEMVSTKLDSARDLAVRERVMRMMDELGDLRVSSSEFADISERGRRAIDRITVDSLLDRPTFTDWLTDANRLRIQPDQIKAVAASDLLHRYTPPDTQGVRSVLSEMLQRDNEMIDRLRAGNVGHESSGNSQRAAEEDQDDDEAS